MLLVCSAKQCLFSKQDFVGRVNTAGIDTQSGQCLLVVVMGVVL